MKEIRKLNKDFIFSEEEQVLESNKTTEFFNKLKDELLEYRDEVLEEILPEEQEKIRSYLENSSNDRKKKLH